MKGCIEDADIALDLNRQCISLNTTNPVLQCNLTSNLAMSLRSRAVTGTINLDDLEQSIEYLREAFQSCPPQHILRNHIVEELSFSLGIHFQNSGRLSALNEIIAFDGSLDLGTILQIPTLAINIAQAMIDRSQTTDARAASTLSNRAVRLLESRSRCILDRQEKSGVYYGLVQVCQLQLRLGWTPTINSVERIALAKESLSMSDHYDRCEMAVSLVLSLIALADEIKDCRLLDEAESVIDQELRL
jgi:hypothetical protein